MPPDPPAPDLPALVAARICHDLISPLGAIGNGLELLDMLHDKGQPAARATPELALVRDSADAAAARIGFFRIAFGTVRMTERIVARDLLAMLNAWQSGGRLTIGWHGDGELPRPDARLLCLLMACAESALPRHGRLMVGMHDAPWNRTWSLTAQGSGLHLDPGLWSMLAPAPAPLPADLRPAHVQFALAARHLHDFGTALDWYRAGDTLTIRFSGAA